MSTGIGRERQHYRSCSKTGKGEPHFGEKAEEKAEIAAKVLRGYPVTPLAEPVSYENMVIYKVHPRGYTMQKTSECGRREPFRDWQRRFRTGKNWGLPLWN